MRWIERGESVEIAGFRIEKGLIYVSEGECPEDEASLINTCLAAASPARGEAAQLPYWPEYATLTPSQRGHYLEWLAAGRKDKDPDKREFGYLFLFIYGVERRLLIDKQWNLDTLNGVLKLLPRYAVYGRSKSLPYYVCQLLHFWGAQQDPELYARIWPQVLATSGVVTGEDELNLIMANLHRRQCPLSADLALILAPRLEESRQSVVVSRVPEELASLFRQRYHEKFGDGLALRAAKRESVLEYRPASPSLQRLKMSQAIARSSFWIDAPNLRGIPSQFKPLSGIWNSCIDDLSVYSRAKAKPGNALKAHSALPAELKQGVKHPLQEGWDELVGTNVLEEGRLYVRIGDLAAVLGVPQAQKLTLGQSKDLAAGLESFRMTIEPDARWSRAPYAWDQQVGLFPYAQGVDYEPSAGFLAALALLQLCVLIAGADGVIDARELDVFREVLEQAVRLTPVDHERLAIQERLLTEDSSLAQLSLARIASKLPSEKRSAIAEIVVRVAAIDGFISKDERRVLQRVFAALGQSAQSLEALIGRVLGKSAEVTVIEGRPEKPGEEVPSPAGFHLDMSRVREIAAQTSEVIGILSSVMTEEPESTVRPQETPQAQTERIGPLQMPTWMEGLESKYRPLLASLVERSNWSRSDFEGLCAQHRMMPLGVLDSINEWSDETLGDFLLSADEGIEVQRNLIPSKE